MARTRATTENIKQYLMSRVYIKDGHWYWQAGRNKAGYGELRYNDTKELAHRVSYMVFKGPILPATPLVLHTIDCNKPRCINPEHLYLGTDLDNARDKVHLDRQHKKYSDEVVAQVRDLYFNFGYTQTSIASILGMCQSNISLIVRGEARCCSSTLKQSDSVVQPS
jgi:hypothetical protein